jgi:hypothetical protein
MSLVSYGNVQNFGPRSRSAVRQSRPQGESFPMAERWADIFERAHPDALPELLDEAQAELDAWLHRPLAPDTTETLEELGARIVRDGWGISADECARAMRCTPTLVRTARLAEGKHPETGHSLPARESDAMSWALRLNMAGLSLREIEALTGVPKTTLHRRLSGPQRATRAGG